MGELHNDYYLFHITTQLTSDFPDSCVEKRLIYSSKLRFFALLSEKSEAT